MIRPVRYIGTVAKQMQILSVHINEPFTIEICRVVRVLYFVGLQLLGFTRYCVRCIVYRSLLSSCSLHAICRRISGPGRGHTIYSLLYLLCSRFQSYRSSHEPININLDLLTVEHSRISLPERFAHTASPFQQLQSRELPPILHSW